MARPLHVYLLLLACAALVPCAALAPRMNVEVTDRVQAEARSNEINWCARAARQNCPSAHWLTVWLGAGRRSGRAPRRRCASGGRSRSRR
jgi:hypothetical protein